MDKNKYKYDVFISYSRKDTNVVDKICKCFDENNITYFIDRQYISGGLEFPKVLAEAIVESKVFLFIASSNSYNSRFTQSEVVFAFNKKQKSDIIPYIIDDSSLPPELELTFSAINWRRKENHSIETTLVSDILERLQKERVVPIAPVSILNKHRIKFILCIAVIGIMLLILLIKLSNNSITKPNTSESLQVDTINKNIVVEVTDSMCINELIGEYHYTGPIDGNKLPNGKGKAIFGNGDIYQGEFLHGKFEGYATYLFAEGHKFVGFFKDNQLFQGTITMNNGDYFSGLFKNGQPDLNTGKWVNSEGVEL